MAETTEEIAVFNLVVITPQRTVYRTEKATDAVFTTVTGDLEIQPHHEPLLIPLTIGRLQIDELNDSGETQEVVLLVHSGFLDMNGVTATVFAYSAETAEEIDAARAKASETRARKRIEQVVNKNANAEHIDEARAERALARALNRMKQNAI